MANAINPKDTIRSTAFVLPGLPPEIAITIKEAVSKLSLKVLRLINFIHHYPHPFDQSKFTSLFSDNPQQNNHHNIKDHSEHQCSSSSP